MAHPTGKKGFLYKPRHHKTLSHSRFFCLDSLIFLAILVMQVNQSDQVTKYKLPSLLIVVPRICRSKEFAIRESYATKESPWPELTTLNLWNITNKEHY